MSADRRLTVGELRRFLNTLPLDGDDQEIHVFEDDGDVIVTEVRVHPERPGIQFFRYGDEPCDDEEIEDGDLPPSWEVSLPDPENPGMFLAFSDAAHRAHGTILGLPSLFGLVITS